MGVNQLWRVGSGCQAESRYEITARFDKLNKESRVELFWGSIDSRLHVIGPRRVPAGTAAVVFDNVSSFQGTGRIECLVEQDDKKVLDLVVKRLGYARNAAVRRRRVFVHRSGIGEAPRCLKRESRGSPIQVIAALFSSIIRFAGVYLPCRSWL